MGAACPRLWVREAANLRPLQRRQPHRLVDTAHWDESATSRDALGSGWSVGGSSLQAIATTSPSR